MKGIILAGGFGTRLYPMTTNISKQLLPIYDKPMIYYSISTLMELKIREILIISSKNFIPIYKDIFKNFNNFGLKILFKEQKYPNGIAESFIIGKKFIGRDNVTLILGDNFFYGINYDKIDLTKLNKNFGAKIFTYKVNEPKNYGVISLKNKEYVSKIEEKPRNPKSNFVATGLYVYDNTVVKNVKMLKPSKRGELEISDLNNLYIKQKKLEAVFLNSGSVWLDAGTAQDLLKASHFVQTIQDRQKILIGSPEAIALKNGWITKSELKKIINKMPKNEYSKNLLEII